MSEQDHIGGPHGGHRYDPNQPRVPPANPPADNGPTTGGHDAGADPGRKFVRDTTGEESWNFFFNTFRPDGSLAEQVVFNRDRSRIVSEFNAPGGAEDWDERHTVFPPDGGKFTFENSGDTQTIYDGDGRPHQHSGLDQRRPGAAAVGAAGVPSAASPLLRSASAWDRREAR